MGSHVGDVASRNFVVCEDMLYIEEALPKDIFRERIRQTSIGSFTG